MNSIDAEMLLRSGAEMTELADRLAKAWKVTELEAIQQLIELANLQLDDVTEFVSDESVAIEIKDDPIFRLGAIGKSWERISEAERVRLRLTIPKLIRDRTRDLQAEKKPTTSARIKALKELQRSLHLTPADAAEWQNVIRLARR